MVLAPDACLSPINANRVILTNTIIPSNEAHTPSLNHTTRVTPEGAVFLAVLLSCLLLSFTFSSIFFSWAAFWGLTFILPLVVIHTELFPKPWLIEIMELWKHVNCAWETQVKLGLESLYQILTPFTKWCIVIWEVPAKPNLTLDYGKY